MPISTQENILENQVDNQNPEAVNPAAITTHYEKIVEMSTRIQADYSKYSDKNSSFGKLLGEHAAYASEAKVSCYGILKACKALEEISKDRDSFRSANSESLRKLEEMRRNNIEVKDDYLLHIDRKANEFDKNISKSTKSILNDGKKFLNLSKSIKDLHDKHADDDMKKQIESGQSYSVTLFFKSIFDFLGSVVNFVKYACKEDGLQHDIKSIQTNIKTAQRGVETVQDKIDAMKGLYEGAVNKLNTIKEGAVKATDTIVDTASNLKEKVANEILSEEKIEYKPSGFTSAVLGGAEKLFGGGRKLVDALFKKNNENAMETNAQEKNQSVSATDSNLQSGQINSLTHKSDSRIRESGLVDPKKYEEILATDVGQVLIEGLSSNINMTNNTRAPVEHSNKAKSAAKQKNR